MITPLDVPGVEAPGITDRPDIESDGGRDRGTNGDVQPDREDGNRKHGFADHRTDEDPLGCQAEYCRSDHAPEQGQPEVPTAIESEVRHHVGPKDHHRRMRKAEHLHRLVDDHEAQGQQDVDRRERQPRHGGLEELGHAYIPSIRSANWSARTLRLIFWVAVSSP